MTLVVSANWIDAASGGEIDFTDWNDGHHMAGPESARQELWGSESIKKLGAKYLPQLSVSDLFVSNENLDELEREVRLLGANIDLIRSELKRKDDCALPHYLANFLRAIETARQHGGGFSIS
jgi:hypothetical protein